MKPGAINSQSDSPYHTIQVTPITKSPTTPSINAVKETRKKSKKSKDRSTGLPYTSSDNNLGKGACINYVDKQKREGVLVKCQRYFISLCSRRVRGVKILKILST